MDFDSYSFEVVWDYEGNIRQFLLRYYPAQEGVEMVDILKRKMFMKRTKVPGLCLAHLNIGSTVSVLNRQLLVMAFADEFTKRAMQELFQRSIVVFKANAHIGSILESLTNGGNANLMTVTRIKMLVLEREDILKLGLVGLCHFTGPSICAEITGNDAVKKCQDVMGLISSCYEIQDFCYAAPDVPTADWTLRSIFDKPRPNTAICDDTGILCLIKPHAVREGLVARIVKAILGSGFGLNAIDTVVLDRNIAEDFLELYKGVVPEYLLRGQVVNCRDRPRAHAFLTHRKHIVPGANRVGLFGNAWVDQLASGPSVILEVQHPSGGTHEKFRPFVGPADPSVARTIRPDSLRAQFGRDKICSAVHCTDLERDCAGDLEFIFRYIAKRAGV